MLLFYIRFLDSVSWQVSFGNTFRGIKSITFIKTGANFQILKPQGENVFLFIYMFRYNSIKICLEDSAFFFVPISPKSGVGNLISF